MENTNRIKIAIHYLASQGIIDNQQGFADKMGYPKATMSSIVNGRLPLSDKFIHKLNIVFPEINTEWLMTGEGEMLKSGNTATNTGTGYINQQNTHGDNNVTQSNDLIGILKEQGHQLTTSQAQLTTAQEQINKLIEILGRKL